MQSRTSPGLPGIAARVRREIKSHRRLAELIAAGLCGAVMANAGLFGSASPFGVAFAAALGQPHAMAAVLGAILGYLFRSGASANLRYLAALVIVAGLRSLPERKLREKYAALAASLSAALSLGIAAAVLLGAGEATMYDLLSAVAEVLLGAGAAYFFRRSLRAMRSGWSAIGRGDVSCLVVSLVVVVMGFAGIPIGSLSAGRILAALIILLAARVGAESGGAVAGVTAGIALGLAGGDYAYSVSAYGFGGLMAGVFAGLGKAAAGGALLVSVAIAALYAKTGGEVYSALVEIFIAASVFLVIPASAVAGLRRGGLARLAERDASAQAALRARLAEVSAALLEVSGTTRLVSERLRKLEPPQPRQSQSQPRVCSRCAMRETCWQSDAVTTRNAMEEASAIQRRGGSLRRETLPRHFAKACVKADELAAELNARFQRSLARENTRRRVSRARGVVGGQFESMALMLREMSAELTTVTMLEPDKARKAREYFEKSGLAIETLRCYRDAAGRVTVELSFPVYQRPRLKGPEAAADLSVILDVELDLPYLTVLDENASAAFHERAAFTAEAGACQIAPEGNRLCGDVYESIPNRMGRAHFILSDGMGSGGAAAVEAGMAASLLARLLAVGFTHESALMMVNAALLIKSGEESLATVDVCTLDLYTGRASFYKAGAAPSFVVRSGRAGSVESASLPAGILTGVAFETSSLTLGDGDIVVLVSDGVTANGAGWLPSELESLRGLDMQSLAEKLAMTAKLRRRDNREDDITVLAIMLHRG